MKLWFIAVALALLLSGCLWQRSGSSAGSSAANAKASSGATSRLIVTPEALLVGRVRGFNAAGRFVVLDFPIGRMPAPEQLMFVYRGGLKVGEVRITGPQRDNNTVADVISGEAQRGDEVRDQ
jgi:hypothetical protein